MALESSLPKGTISTAPQLLRRLEEHDWEYLMSDDHSAWTAGAKDWDEIVEGTKSVPNGSSIRIAYQTARNLAYYGHK